MFRYCKIAKLPIFGWEYQKMAVISFENPQKMQNFKNLQRCGLRIGPPMLISKFQNSKLKLVWQAQLSHVFEILGDYAFFKDVLQRG